MNKSIVIAIDFDGTVVTHDFPNVGKDIGADPVLKRLVAEGHQLILWTMRHNEIRYSAGETSRALIIALRRCESYFRMRYALVRHQLDLRGTHSH